MRYGMVIDLKKCSGCMSCDVACKRENFTPPGVHWSRVHIYETGTYPTVKLRSLPTHCMHCEEPACKKACPTGATTQRADGIVQIDNEVCIGCGYCALACPYEARSLNRTDPQPYHPAFGTSATWTTPGVRSPGWSRKARKAGWKNWARSPRSCTSTSTNT